MIVEGLLRRQMLKLSRGIDGSNRDAGREAGIFQAQALTIEQDEYGASRIPHLLRLQCPCAVLLGIAKLVILSLEAMVQARTRPHVGEKVSKVAPRRIDGDTSTAVMPVRFVVRVGAAVNHALPGVVFRTCAGTPSMTMLFRRTLEAAARLCFSAGKLVRLNDGLVSAAASANPSRLSCGRIIGATKNGQQVEYLTGQLQWIHDGIVPYMVHDMPGGKLLCRW